MNKKRNMNRLLSILWVTTALHAFVDPVYAMDEDDFSQSSSLQRKLENKEFIKQKKAPLFTVEKFHEYSKIALNNDAEGQYNMGVSYKYGYFVKKDYKTAMEWFRRAAQQNHAESQNHIGLLYAQGEAVDQNNEKAMKWFCKSQAQGNIDAEYYIGMLYLNGEGILIEGGYESRGRYALFWLRSAAEKNHAEARYMIGLIYLHGLGGIKQDYKEAKQWYTLAAEQGDNYAKDQLRYIESCLQPSPSPCVIL